MPSTVHVQVACPNCRHELRVRAEYIGLTVACKYCDNPFLVQLEDVAAASAGPATAVPEPAGGDKPGASERRIKALETEVQLSRVHLESQAALHVATLEVLKEREEELARARERARVLDSTVQALEEAREERDQLHTDLALLRLRALEADRLASELAAERAETERLRAALYEAEARFIAGPDRRAATSASNVHDPSY